MERYHIIPDGDGWLLWKDGSRQTVARFEDRQEALRCGMRLAHRSGARLVLSPQTVRRNNRARMAA